MPSAAKMFFESVIALAVLAQASRAVSGQVKQEVLGKRAKFYAVPANSLKAKARRAWQAFVLQMMVNYQLQG